MENQANGRVLLSGVTGFLGSHMAIQLLENNYEVTGTLRNMNRADQIREVIAKHTAKSGQLRFAEADLLDEGVWKELTRDVDFVQHVASPFPRELPKHEEDLILPAKKGVLNVLAAASINGVKRVVLTSSIAAVMYGRDKKNRSGLYNETHWTDFTNKKDSTPYYRSKTIAEKAAWDFMEKDKSGMELVTVCPGAILGPVLESDFGTSANLVIKLLDGSTPALPDLGFEIVDVRSVAGLLIRAMEMPEAANQRYLATAGYVTFKEVAQILKEAYPNKKIPSKTLPSFLVSLLSNFDKTLKPILPDLGETRKADNSKAKTMLNWEPIPNREAILSCAGSVMELGIV